jgi:hypothetical protein
MHTIQYIATQADNIDEAHRRVKDSLETMLGDEYGSTNTWYDWFVVGGGRWATGEENQYNDDFTGDVVHQSNTRFQDYLDLAKNYRKGEFDSYMESAKKVDYASYLDKLSNEYGNELTYPHELYAIKKVYDMAMSIWDYNSYYYDQVHDSTNMVHLQNSLDKGDKDWYLVPVDFHY